MMNFRYFQATDSNLIVRVGNAGTVCLWYVVIRVLLDVAAQPGEHSVAAPGGARGALERVRVHIAISLGDPQAAVVVSSHIIRRTVAEVLRHCAGTAVLGHCEHSLLVRGVEPLPPRSVVIQ